MPFRSNQLNRRSFLRAGALGLLGLAGGVALKANQQGQALAASLPAHPPAQGGGHGQHMFMPGTVGEVDHAANGFNPTDILTDFDYGTVSTLPSGQTLREFLFVAQIKDIEVVPGIVYQAWTYNGRVPGPTIRARQGDRIRINFLNATGHPHTIHFHGIHPGSMDGVFEPVPPGGQFVYEFDAEPFGVHLYHCHIMPLATHISRGLDGAFIVEPPGGWPQADRELVMVLNGFDLDFDMANDVYAVNTIPFHYDRHPIAIKVGELVRIFLVNILEFDPINSFHLHANLFHYYPTGTSLTPSEYTDMIAQMQAQRGMLEFRYKFPGKYMFHAHKTEFAELGWTGNFQVEA